MVWRGFLDVNNRSVLGYTYIVTACICTNEKARGIGAVNSPEAELRYRYDAGVLSRFVV
jgi:hypothetical protein